MKTNDEKLEYAIELGPRVSVSPVPARETIQLSWRRWPILFAFFTFGLTSFINDKQSSILDTVLEVLEMPVDRYVYISGLFFGNISLLTTMPTAWFTDRYGIRPTMYIATLLMLVRNGARALLFNPDLARWQELKMVYWVVSGVMSVQVLAIYFCLPLKVSENWFSKSERSFAWTVMISVTSIGTSVAAFVYPRFVASVRDVKLLFYVNLVSAIITALAVVLCITRSKPEHPPSERMIKSSKAAELPYLDSIKRMLAHKDLMIHLMCATLFKGFGVAAGGLLQDILISSGHERTFPGTVMSASALVSLVSMIGLSTLVHRLHNITLVCKLTALAQVILFAVNMLTILHPSPGWAVLLAAFAYQISASWASPNNNNMNAHLASGVVSESTVSGFATTLTVLSISVSKTAFASLIRKTVDGKSDYTYAIYFTIAVSSLMTLAYVWLFEGKELEVARDEKGKGEKEKESSGG